MAQGPRNDKGPSAGTRLANHCAGKHLRHPSRLESLTYGSCQLGEVLQ
jgi:hypothetical protein